MEVSGVILEELRRIKAKCDKRAIVINFNLRSRDVIYGQPLSSAAE